MWIKKLHIENYKSIQRVDVELSEDINIFIGKNNSGKSNIIDAFTFLSDFVTRRKDGVGSRGGFGEIVFGKDEKKIVTFDLEIILTERDMLNLYSKLQLDSNISFEKFKTSISNKIRYTVEFGKDMIPIQEKIYIYSNNKEIIYAEGNWDGRMYMYKIIKDLRVGIIDDIWELTGYGGGSPSESILHKPFNHRPINQNERLFCSIHDFFVSFYHLNPVRMSAGDMEVLGGIQLASDGSNLPQVLNSLALKNRALFEKITARVIDVAGEIAEIRAPLKEGKKETYLCITEKPFSEDTEFFWMHLSSGVQELLFLITLLHTTPKGSLLMIEEPEIHLHPEAIFKIISLFEKICREDDKQVLITTHSPMLVDAMSFDKIHVVAKIKGETQVKSLSGYGDTGKKLLKQGVVKSWLLLSQVKTLSSGKFILVVEDNVKLWNKFIEKSGLFSNSDKIKVITGKTDSNGGWIEAVKTGVLLKLLNDMGVLSIPFIIVLDSDNKKTEKEKKLGEEKLSTEEYHILEEKEIEDYLLDAEAISKITGKSQTDVTASISKYGGGGKEKLEKVFRDLMGSGYKVSEEVKLLVLVNMRENPGEISSILDALKSRLTPNE